MVNYVFYAFIIQVCYFVCQPADALRNVSVTESPRNEQQKEFIPLIESSEEKATIHDASLNSKKEGSQDQLRHSQPCISPVNHSVKLRTRRKEYSNYRRTAPYFHSINKYLPGQFHRERKGHFYGGEGIHSYKPLDNHITLGFNQRSLAYPRISTQNRYHETKRGYPSRSSLSDPFYHERFLKESFRNSKGFLKQPLITPDRMGLESTYLKQIDPVDGNSSRRNHRLPIVTNLEHNEKDFSVRTFDVYPKRVPNARGKKIVFVNEMPTHSSADSEQMQEKIPQPQDEGPNKNAVSKLELAYGRDLNKPFHGVRNNPLNNPRLVKNFDSPTLKDHRNLMPQNNVGYEHQHDYNCPMPEPIKYPVQEFKLEEVEKQPQDSPDLESAHSIAEPEIPKVFDTNPTYQVPECEAGHAALLREPHYCTCQSEPVGSESHEAVEPIESDNDSLKTPKCDHQFLSKVITLSKRVEGPLPRVQVRIMVNNKEIPYDRLRRSLSFMESGAAFRRESNATEHELKSALQSGVRSNTFKIKKIPSSVQLSISINNQTSRPVSIDIQK